MICTIHHNHPHRHGVGCGHTTIRHGDHIDYLHDGHLYHVYADHLDEHTIEISADNPAECNHAHRCTGHATAKAAVTKLPPWQSHLLPYLLI